jgi:similar to probable replication protein of bacteriophage
MSNSILNLVGSLTHFDAAHNFPISMPTKSVLVCLANYANDAGRCWPSYATISEWSCIRSKATISKAISQLKEYGLITVAGQADSKGRKSSNLYIFNIDRLKELRSSKQSDIHKNSEEKLIDNNKFDSQVQEMNIDVQEVNSGDRLKVYPSSRDEHPCSRGEHACSGDEQACSSGGGYPSSRGEHKPLIGTINEPPLEPPSEPHVNSREIEVGFCLSLNKSQSNKYINNNKELEKIFEKEIEEEKEETKQDKFTIFQETWKIRKEDLEKSKKIWEELTTDDPTLCDRLIRGAELVNQFQRLSTKHPGLQDSDKINASEWLQGKSWDVDNIMYANKSAFGLENA